MKRKFPLIGIDDGGFQLFNTDWRWVDVFGVIMRGTSYTECIVKTTIQKDDPSPTTSLIEMIRNSGHLQNLKGILHKGVTIGGFGVIDASQLVSDLGIPFIAILNREPDFDSIKNALSRFDDGERRWRKIQKHGTPQKIRDGLWIQPTGIDFSTARFLVEHAIAVGNVPEPLRIAHMIGKAIYDEKIRLRH